MATLLNAVTANTEGTGTQITGDFEAIVPNTSSCGGGEILLQVSDSDTPSRYVTIEIFLGPGARTIRNNGAKFFRGVLRNVQSSMPTPSATLLAEQ